MLDHKNITCETSEELTSIIEKEYGNIASVILVRENKTVYEHYFHGYSQEDTIHIASVTKSVISALIGIAIDKGIIKNPDQKVLDFFPDYKIKRGEKRIQEVAIKDLLSMTAPYKYKYEPYTKVYSSDDWTKAVLHLLGGKGAIGEFKYTTVGIQALSGVIAAASGQSVLDFANDNLFEPLEIKKPKNITIENKEEHFSFLKGEYVEGWVVDPNGVNTAGWGLCLTTRDITKIGQLYLGKGMWNKQRILSDTWIEESTKVHSKWGDRKYGYLWWIIEDNKSYAAIGDGGNIIYVSPEKEMVVSITSKFMPRAKDRLQLIHNFIMQL